VLLLLTQLTKDAPDKEPNAWVDINRYLHTGDYSPVTSDVNELTDNSLIPFD